MSLKNHFTSDKYDFFKYKGKNRAKLGPFLERRDRIWFDKITKHIAKKDLESFFIANILKDRTSALLMGKLEVNEAIESYKNYVKRKQAFSYYFQQDISQLLKKTNDPKNIFQSEKHEYPPILTEYLGDRISLDTLVVLDDFISFSNIFDKRYGKDDVVWETISLKIRKYRPFLSYDREKVKKIMEMKLLNIEKE